jgi:lysophospholipase L1-like esterase
MMQSVRLLPKAALVALWGICAFGWMTSARSEATLACDHFTQDLPMPPEPRDNPGARKRADEITRRAQSHQYSVVFLGDSLTHWWNHNSWDRHFGRWDPLNAGVSGDRTEHLLWRIENGNLYQQPKVVVLLIGTNDLSHNRTPRVTAERIRDILETLRKRLPATRILLEGLWPRNDQARLIPEPKQVNELVAQCDGGAISFQDLGPELLDAGHQLTHEIAYDGLHLSERGYEQVSPPIAEKLKAFLSVP